VGEDHVWNAKHARIFYIFLDCRYYRVCLSGNRALLECKESQHEKSLGRFYSIGPDRRSPTADRQEWLVYFPAAHPDHQLDSSYHLDGEVLQGLRCRKRVRSHHHHHHDTYPARLHRGHSCACGWSLGQVQVRWYDQVHSLIG